MKNKFLKSKTRTTFILAAAILITAGLSTMGLHLSKTSTSTFEQKDKHSKNATSIYKPGVNSIDDTATKGQGSDKTSVKIQPPISSQNGESCTKTQIPYRTVTQYSPYISQGQQLSYGGLEGSEAYCTNSRGEKRLVATIQPVDKTIVIGTANSNPVQNPPQYDPNYGKVPTLTEINSLLTSIALPGQMKVEKIYACAQLFSSRGVSDISPQGYHVCSDLVLSDYSAY